MEEKAQRILKIYEEGVSETELTETLKTKINASTGGYLGSIKPTDAAPTPARNGNYTFSLGGDKPAWLTAEAGVTEVKAGDGVAVVYTEPSSYTYTHVDTGSSIEQARSQSTSKVPSSKLVDDELNLKFDKTSVVQTTGASTTQAMSQVVVSKSIQDQSNLVFTQRKNKYLTYDNVALKLKVIGSDAVQPSDLEIFTIVFDGISYTINGSAYSEQAIAVGQGNSQLVILKSATDVVLTLADILVFNDTIDRSSTHIKLAHITYNEGITSRLIKDYRQFTPTLRKDTNNIFNYNVVNRKNKYLTYDPSSSKLKIIGSDAAQPSDLEIFTIVSEGILYRFVGAANTELSISVGTGNAQLFILKSNINKDINLADIEIFNDTTDRSATHIKLAHIIYNDGISSQVIQDYRNFYPLIKTKIDSFESSFIFNRSIISRKRKWISYDRVSEKLIVVGSDSASPSDELIVTLEHDSVRYLINGFVGTERKSGIVYGNSQICLSKTIADKNNIRLTDFEIFNDVADRSATHIKLAHITYNDAIESDIIIDYQDYVNQQRAFSPLVAPGSFINNSVGETNFANGVQPKLKILGFGNSFMRNSVHYLSAIASNGIGVNLTVGNLYTGGTNLNDHLSAMVNGTNPYVWNKYENGVNTESLNNQTAEFGLKSERWDAVILHQYTPWTQPFEPYLNLVIAKIIEILGYCPKFYLNSTWAGHEDYVLEQYGFATELEMWEYMLTANEGACTDSGINLTSIIPTGTAIQNARTLAFADAYNRFTNGGDDWHHLNPAGGFIAACAIYEKIVYPLNKIHCSDTTFRITASTSLPPSDPIEEGILVTNDNYLSMCQSVIDAVENPDIITNQL